MLGPLRQRLRLTFAGESETIPAWETALEDGDDAGFFPPDSAVWAVQDPARFCSCAVSGADRSFVSTCSLIPLRSSSSSMHTQ